MTVFGVDLSLRSTGLASFDGHTWDTATIKTTPEDQTPESFLIRVDNIAAKAVSWMDPRDGDVIAMEGPALHAKSSQLDRMFAAWWLVFKTIHAHHESPLIVPPATLKKFATGKGNADKGMMRAALDERVPGHAATNNDTTDASWLAVAASVWDGHPIVGTSIDEWNQLLEGIR